MDQRSSSSGLRKIYITGAVLVIVLAFVILRSLTSSGTIIGRPEASQTLNPEPVLTASGVQALSTAVLTPDQLVQTIQPAVTADPTPGLVIYGHVLDGAGSGFGNVSIYRAYASYYPGVVIATTDPSGYYESNYYYIPGDEMVAVWAEGSGMSFDPEYYRWRHYYGYERRECDFVVNLP